jgi:hypothetical protein
MHEQEQTVLVFCPASKVKEARAQCTSHAFPSHSHITQSSFINSERATQRGQKQMVIWSKLSFLDLDPVVASLLSKSSCVKSMVKVSGRWSPGHRQDLRSCSLYPTLSSSAAVNNAFFISLANSEYQTIWLKRLRSRRLLGKFFFQLTIELALEFRFWVKF